MGPQGGEIRGHTGWEREPPVGQLGLEHRARGSGRGHMPRPPMDSGSWHPRKGALLNCEINRVRPSEGRGTEKRRKGALLLIKKSLPSP